MAELQSCLEILLSSRRLAPEVADPTAPFFIRFIVGGRGAISSRNLIGLPMSNFPCHAGRMKIKNLSGYSFQLSVFPFEAKRAGQSLSGKIRSIRDNKRPLEHNSKTLMGVEISTRTDCQLLFAAWPHDDFVVRSHLACLFQPATAGVPVSSVPQPP